MKTKITVAKEFTLKQLTPDLVDYAIDRATTGPMTTRFGSHAFSALQREYGEAKVEAAWELVGKPLKDRLEAHVRAMTEITKNLRLEIARHNGW